RTPAEHLASFRKSFGDDLARLDKKVDDYVRKLSRQPGYDPLPYYAVMMVQPLGGSAIRKVATFSQSPQVIQEWLEASTEPQGGPIEWQFLQCRTRSQAMLVVQQWMRGY